jgi:hypothetical protein
MDLQRPGNPVQSLQLAVALALPVVAARFQTMKSFQPLHRIARPCSSRGGVCNDATIDAAFRFNRTPI